MSSVIATYTTPRPTIVGIRPAPSITKPTIAVALLRCRSCSSSTDVLMIDYPIRLALNIPLAGEDPDLVPAVNLMLPHESPEHVHCAQRRVEDHGDRESQVDATHPDECGDQSRLCHDKSHDGGPQRNPDHRERRDCADHAPEEIRGGGLLDCGREQGVHWPEDHSRYCEGRQ